MLNRFISNNLKYSCIFSRSNLFASIYNINFKNFAKKDKGRLSDSDSKRGAKATTSEDSAETITYSSSNDSPSSSSNSSANKVEIQTVEKHKVIILYNNSHLCKTSQLLGDTLLLYL